MLSTWSFSNKLFFDSFIMSNSNNCQLTAETRGGFFILLFHLASLEMKIDCDPLFHLRLYSYWGERFVGNSSPRPSAVLDNTLSLVPFKKKLPPMTTLCPPVFRHCVHKLGCQCEYLSVVSLVIHRL